MATPAYSPHAYIRTSKGEVQIELAVLDAPRTVANFVALVRKGFFDGVRLHRVVPDFVVQDGDPRGDGEGGPGYTIRDELNERPYLRGTVGMALDWKDTGGSQFFITHSPQPHLDARYTVFGQVVDGMAVVDRLEPWDLIQSVRVWDGRQWIAGPASDPDGAVDLTAPYKKKGAHGAPWILQSPKGDLPLLGGLLGGLLGLLRLLCHVISPPSGWMCAEWGAAPRESHLPPGTLRRRAGPPASCADPRGSRQSVVRGKTGQFETNRPEGHRRPTSSSRSSWPPSWPPSLPSSPLFLLRDLTPPNGDHRLRHYWWPE